MLLPYKTIARRSETETVINRSRFIGRAYPVQTEDEALSILAAIRKQHYDATHNCFAYIIKDGAARFSDDGEPSGTAGMPIMEVLKSRELVNTLVIVTRYFGGILLGAGGLVRAYSGSCADAVRAAVPVSILPGTKLTVSLDYSRYNALEDFLRANTVISDIRYAENVTLTLLIKSSKLDKFISDITEKTDGRIIPDVCGEEYMQTDDE